MIFMSTEQNIQFCRDHHDHQSCMKTAIAKAEQVCESRNQRFTKLRKRILLYRILKVRIDKGSKIHLVHVY